MFAVGADIPSLAILMPSVLSFSSSNSESRFGMEHNTDLNGSLSRRYRTTLFEHKELQQET